MQENRLGKGKYCAQPQSDTRTYRDYRLNMKQGGSCVAIDKSSNKPIIRHARRWAEWNGESDCM